MKLATFLAFAALSPILPAQTAPPPPMMGARGAGMAPQVSSPSRATRASATPTTDTETIRILGLSTVQNDLGLTAAEVRDLGSVARTLRGSVATEDAALTAVSKVLTSAQTARLRELLVQDLGYNSLSITSVRMQLNLTEEQSSQIESLVSVLETTTAALANSTDATTATKVRSAVLTTTSSRLAQVLTEEQDKKLRALAGRLLGTK